MKVFDLTWCSIHLIVSFFCEAHTADFLRDISIGIPDYCHHNVSIGFEHSNTIVVWCFQ